MTPAGAMGYTGVSNQTRYERLKSLCRNYRERRRTGNGIGVRQGSFRCWRC